MTYSKPGRDKESATQNSPLANSEQNFDQIAESKLEDQVTSRITPSGKINSATLTPANILNLQSTIGNRRVTRMLAERSNLSAVKSNLTGASNIKDRPGGTGNPRTLQRKLNPIPTIGQELEGDYFDDFLGAMVKIIKVIKPAFMKENVIKSGGVYVIEEVPTKDKFHYNSQLETYSRITSPQFAQPLVSFQTGMVVKEFRDKLQEKQEEVDKAIMDQLKTISTLEMERAIETGKKAFNKIYNTTIGFSKKSALAVANQKYGAPLTDEQFEEADTEVKELITDYIEQFVTTHVNQKKALYLAGDGKLLRGAEADIPVEKLTGYCLKADHPVGKFKAVQFKNQLGITADNYLVLKNALQNAAKDVPGEIGSSDQHGQRVTIYFKMKGVDEKADNESTVLSGWIYPKVGDAPKLTSCYIVAGKGVAYRAFFKDFFLVTEDDWPEHLQEPHLAYKAGKREAREETRVTKKSGRLYQKRIYDGRGYPVKDIDYTSPTNDAGDPHPGGEGEHLPPPHQHKWTGDPEKGFVRGAAEEIQD